MASAMMLRAFRQASAISPVTMSARINCSNSNINKRSSSSFSADSNRTSETTLLADPVRQVFISQSNDIFTNLAVEDWLYQHHDFDHKHLLLLWRNSPCVVIGRHQNPWTEANVPFLRREKIGLARRNSGGGTVYHDMGNLNCTFFTRKSLYLRRRNLDVICSAINRMTGLDVAVNHREDIVLDESHKISGTAAKLGRDNAYHHCTVLVDVNECVLHDALNSQADNVESRATQSVRVPVRNLRSVDPSVDILDLQAALGWEFLRTNIDGVDEGMQGARRQRGFTKIRPDDGYFPGISRLREDLASHQWIFGKTPRFKVHRTFELPQDMVPQDDKSQAANGDITIELDVHLGVVQDVRVLLPAPSPMSAAEDTHLGNLNLGFDLSDSLHGIKFGKDMDVSVRRSLNERSVPSHKVDFLSDCIKSMVGNFA